ncbi:MAG: hypothetical protein JRH12_20140, partial [Deltaproteobacteria bacterium]|nr:hypothetical protein [Deltaproteobacteria bacterium]
YLPTSIAAFQATNDLLARGLTLYRMAESFTDSGRSFPAGAVIVPGLPALADELANQYALDVSALSGIPETAVLMKKQKIAVYGDEGVMHCLKTLGFDFDEVSPGELNTGAIAGYDVFLNRDLKWSRLNRAGKASMAAWFAAGGDYIGLACQGVGTQFAIDAGIADVAYVSVAGNAIVKIGYNPDDTVSAGFLEDGFAFFYYPMWFTDYDGMDVSAHLDGGDFLVSGLWPGWQASGANGMPVIVHGEKGDKGIQDTVLIGIDPTFRGHPENTFRLVGNAIFAGLD